MATLLDPALVTDTLASLPGWQGDGTRLWRDVHVSPDIDTELRRQVAVDSAAMGHAAVAEPIAGGTRYVLRSEESGGVTELDVALASHISDLVHRLSAAEPGIDAVRDDDPIVVFRAGEGADGTTEQSPAVHTGATGASVAGGSAPVNLPAGVFSPQERRH